MAIVTIPIGSIARDSGLLLHWTLASLVVFTFDLIHP